MVSNVPPRLFFHSADQWKLKSHLEHTTTVLHSKPSSSNSKFQKFEGVKLLIVVVLNLDLIIIIILSKVLISETTSLDQSAKCPL